MKASISLKTLSARVNSVIKDGCSDDQFNALALDIHSYQSKHCSAIGRLTKGVPKSWREIPLVPTSAFAGHAIATFPPAEAVRIFESSGTTRGTRSRHYFRDLSLYRATTIAAFKRIGTFQVKSLIDPSASSSLSCMVDWIKEESTIGAPSFVIGTAFAYVHLIDEGFRDPLSPGSVVAETGGYKGKGREVSKEELYRGISEVFSIGQECIMSEYGMCELSTSFWEEKGARGFVIPHWARVRLIDPETMEDTAGQGVIAIYDLANLESSISILTSDIGSFLNGRLILHGRMSRAPQKGCSLLID